MAHQLIAGDSLSVNIIMASISLRFGAIVKVPSIYSFILVENIVGLNAISFLSINSTTTFPWISDLTLTQIGPCDAFQSFEQFVFPVDGLDVESMQVPEF